MDKINFWVELWNRFDEKSPIFFRKLQSIGNWLSATGIGLVGVPAALNAVVETDINLELMVKIASYMILAGLIINIVSKLPVKDADYETLDKKPEK